MTEDTTKTRNCGLINRNGIRRYILDYAQQRRPGKFTRVSDDVYIKLEQAMRTQIEGIVDHHPSLGKTIMV